MIFFVRDITIAGIQTIRMPQTIGTTFLMSKTHWQILGETYVTNFANFCWKQCYLVQCNIQVLQKNPKKMLISSKHKKWMLVVINWQNKWQCYFFVLSLLIKDLECSNQNRHMQKSNISQTWKFHYEQMKTVIAMAKKNDFWGFLFCPFACPIFMNVS